MSSVLKKKKLQMKEKFFKKSGRICIYSPQSVIQVIVSFVRKSMREYNLRRHYEAIHQDKYDGYKGNARKEKVKQLKLSLCKQRSFFAYINQSNENSVRAGFAISKMIAKSSQPFTEGLFIKECLLKAGRFYVLTKRNSFKASACCLIKLQAGLQI